MKRSLNNIKQLIFISVYLLLSSSGCTREQYDRPFGPIVLSADKQHYQVGDEIKLKVAFDYVGKIRIFKDFSKNAQLIIGEWQGQNYIGYLSFPDRKRFFQSRESGIYAQDPIEDIYSNKPQEVIRYITGRVKQQDSKIVVEFDGFNNFILDGPKTLDVYLFFLPIKPGPLDSFEDLTNHISLKFG